MIFQFQPKFFSFEFGREGIFFSQVLEMLSAPSKAGEPKETWNFCLGLIQKRGSRPSAASPCKLWALGLRQAQWQPLLVFKILTLVCAFKPLLVCRKNAFSQPLNASVDGDSFCWFVLQASEHSEIGQHNACWTLLPVW